MTGAIELRQGSARDIDAVGRVMARAFDPRYGEAWTGPQCLGMLALPGVWLTLAEIYGRTVGFALARVAADSGELLLIAVDPALGGRGIGGRLLRAVIADARARGAATLHLEMRAGNPATRLYVREGFAKVGERRGYYRGRDGDPFDAHTLSLALAEDAA